MHIAARLANRAKDILFLPAFDQVWRSRLCGKVACLLYHRVAEPGAAPFLDACGAAPVPPLQLARELRFHQRHGARFMTLSDLREGKLPAASEFGVLVSFDDGFRDNYDAGLSVLDTLGIKGAIFQSSAMVGAGSLIWEHELYWHWHSRRDATFAAARIRWPALPHGESAALDWLRSSPPMSELEQWLSELTAASGGAELLAQAADRLYPSEADLRRADADGHEIASHGHRHYPRGMIDAAVFEEEIAVSSRRLAAITGTRPRAFSYPFNSRAPGDETICARYFEQVATVDAAPIDGLTSPLSLPRFTWQGPHRNALRQRRWLWTGKV